MSIYWRKVNHSCKLKFCTTTFLKDFGDFELELENQFITFIEPFILHCKKIIECKYFSKLISSIKYQFKLARKLRVSIFLANQTGMQLLNGFR